MQKICLFLLLVFLSVGRMPAGGSGASDPVSDECTLIYESAGLAGQVSYAAFEQAYQGYRKIGNRSKNILTFIDFSKPSTAERLFVIDMEHRCLLHKSHVAHGKNSGGNYATDFSNQNGSHKSSLGFYLTGGTYQGGNGYSLLLDGLEKGINDRARERAIVIHPAAYANPSVIPSAGRLGRSFGCPALPQAVSQEIINTIKGGTVLYIYADSPEYARSSSLLASNHP